MRSVRHQFAVMEILALAVVGVFMLAGFLVLQKSIVSNYIRSQMRDIARVEGIIETIIDDSTQEFETFYITGGDRHDIAFLNEFSDVYRVDHRKRITEVLKKSGKSLVVSGYDAGAGPLGAFLDGVGSTGEAHSSICRPVESDEPGMYVARRTDGGWLVGRIDLHRLNDKLKSIAERTGSLFIIASDDGSILYSANKDLPFRVLPAMEQGQVRTGNGGYSYLRRHIGVLRNDIAVLSPMAGVRNYLWRLRAGALAFALLLAGFVIIKVIVQARMIIRPLQEFSSQITNWNPTDSGLEAPERFLKNRELGDLYCSFRAAAAQVSESMAMLRESREELRKSHERFSILLKNSSDIILVLDESGRVSFVSDSVEGIAGYTPVELIGMAAIEELVHPDDREEMLESFRGMFVDPENVHRVVFRAKTRKAGWMYFEAMGADLLRVEPINGIVLNMRDITARRRIEKQREAALVSLRESEERYRLHFENVSDVIFSLDREGTMLSASPSVEIVLGYRPDELVGRRFYELGILTGDSLRMAVSDMERVFAGNNIRAAVFEFIKRDGTRRFGELNAAPLVKDGGVSALICVARDITERKRMEEELNQAMLQYRNTLDSMGDYIHVIDPDFKIVLMNRSFIEWNGSLGLDTDAVGKSVFEVFPFLPESVRDEYGSVFRDGGMLRTEDTNVIGEREVITETRKIPLVRGGEVAQVVTVIHDITHRKHAERQIERSLHEKETLLRELYHRTKNNMQVISSMLSLQSSYTDNLEMKKTLKEMSNRISSIALVHQKLYRARDLSRIDLKDYIDDLVHLILKAYGPAYGEVTPELSLASVNVLIDVAIPCGLVLNELITNSLKYAFPEGRGGRVRVCLERFSEDELELSCADDGVGLPPDFDYRRSRTLGLMIIFGIVEHQLQGSVAFSGEGGVSCRIRFNPNQYRERV